ncbi:MAG: CcmD family protein [Gammaproteobacteria bacterium]|nr:CcmD family protein [Gammaproteobacteria bacterium]MDE0651053.1 CcmD family protein [Gammaproteobacteria bacterium]
MHILRSRPGIVLVVALVASLASSAPLIAQVGTDVLAQQSLRPYWYVFIAYAVAWLLLLGWMFSIGRRMRGLEEGGTGNHDA